MQNFILYEIFGVHNQLTGSVKDIFTSNSSTFLSQKFQLFNFYE